MSNLENKLETIPRYVILGGVTTDAATPSTVQLDNIKKNLLTPQIRFHQLPEFNKSKGDLPIALVGGGPSVKTQIDEIKKFRTIIACGSSHDWLITQGIIPTYCGICDPDPVIINYLKLKHLETKYLVSSGCDVSIFEYLKDCPIAMWHCHSDDFNDKMGEIEIGYQAIAGGCTIGLRSISIAVMLGYKNIHFFGFDSCLENGEGYAYKLSTQEEVDAQDKIYNLKIGMDWDGPGEKTYACLGYHLAQVENFKRFLIENPDDLFKPTFHGDGLLPDMMKMLEKEILKK